MGVKCIQTSSPAEIKTLSKLCAAKALSPPRGKKGKKFGQVADCLHRALKCKREWSRAAGGRGHWNLR